MNFSIKVYDKLPDGFSAKVEVAAIYVNVNDKILLLQLADHKAEKGAWGVPAGKLETDETSVQAAKRELYEETGIHIESLEILQPLGALYIRKPEFDYIYHLFSLELETLPSLSLSIEHRAHAWVSKEEAITLPLMNGAEQALETYYQKRNS